MTSPTTTVSTLLQVGTAASPALRAPATTALSYQALRQLVADTAAALNRHGIGRNDRVAIVLDNGPCMAAAFLAIASCATAAPLNPAYRTDEFEFYLSDLRAQLLIVAAGSDSPALAVGARLGIP
jgi:acyl-CoA synthetase (AMP-forming)/AMP-acid ligase II